MRIILDVDEDCERDALMAARHARQKSRDEGMPCQGITAVTSSTGRTYAVKFNKASISVTLSR